MESPKNLKQILTDIKGVIGSNIITVGNFNTLPKSMERSPRQKINKERLALNDILEQLESIDISKQSI